MLKKVFVLLFLFCFVCEAHASNVEVWHDPQVRVKQLKKIILMPADVRFDTGMSASEETEAYIRKYFHDDKSIPDTATIATTAANAPDAKDVQTIDDNIASWEITGIRSAFTKKEKKNLIIKTLNEVLWELGYPRSTETPDAEFFRKAASKGYQAFIRLTIDQNIRIVHIPEHTEVKVIPGTEIETPMYTYDPKSKTLQPTPNYIPATHTTPPTYETVVIPAHDIVYRDTVCVPKLYLINDYNGTSKASVTYTISDMNDDRRSTVKLMEDITKASMKRLITQKK